MFVGTGRNTVRANTEIPSYWPVKNKTIVHVYTHNSKNSKTQTLMACLQWPF